MKTETGRFVKSAVMMVPLVLVLSGLVAAYNAADTERFQEAHQAYREGRFDDAVKGYQELAERYPATAVFDYNLGNSFFRSGAMGAAILAYERALLIEPRDRDTRKNLDYVRGLLEYRIEDKRNWYIRAGEVVLKCFTEDEVRFLAFFSFFLFAASWCFVLFFRFGAPWGWWRKTTLMMTLAFFALLLAKGVEMHVMRDAIVMDREVEVRYGPSDGDQVAFRLGEGLKTYVIDRRERWSRIVLENGESGWVKNQSIEEVAQ